MAAGLHFDGDDEPSPAEIATFAERLGMDLEHDQEFLWMATFGLKAKLPREWSIQQSGGAPFYYNVETQEKSWERPCEPYRRAYRDAKARRDAPVRVVTIHGSLQEGSDTLTVRVCGSLHGEELVVLKFQPTVLMRAVRSALAQQLKVWRRTLKIMILDGRLLTADDDGSTLAMALGIDKEEVSSQDDSNTGEW